MKSFRAPSSWRDHRSSLFRPIVPPFLLSTSPTLFTQTNDSATTAHTAHGRGADSPGTALTGVSPMLVHLATELKSLVITGTQRITAFSRSRHEELRESLNTRVDDNRALSSQGGIRL
jgi:hypothetical protein